MATGVTTQKVFSMASLKNYDHDPGGTGAVVVSGDGGTTKNYLDMRDYTSFVLIVMNSVSTSASGPTLVEIVAAETTTGTNVTAIVTSGTVASVTVGDNVVLEVTSEQIKEVAVASGFNLRYVTGRITCSNAGDECVVLMGRLFHRWRQKNLTANNIT